MNKQVRLFLYSFGVLNLTFGVLIASRSKDSTVSNLGAVLFFVSLALIFAMLFSELVTEFFPAGKREKDLDRPSKK